MIIIYFFAVETRKLSLEEIDEVFDAPYPKAYGNELQKLRRAAEKAAKEKNKA